MHNTKNQHNLLQQPRYMYNRDTTGVCVCNGLFAKSFIYTSTRIAWKSASSKYINLFVVISMRKWIIPILSKILKDCCYGVFQTKVATTPIIAWWHYQLYTSQLKYSILSTQKIWSNSKQCHRSSLRVTDNMNKAIPSAIISSLLVTRRQVNNNAVGYERWHSLKKC